jgi:hypothetical protein
MHRRFGCLPGRGIHVATKVWEAWKAAMHRRTPRFSLLVGAGIAIIERD